MDSVKITYPGHACIALSYEWTDIVLDPYRDGMVPGLGDLRAEADFVFCSHGHDDHAYTPAVTVREDGERNFGLEELIVPHDDAGGSLRGMNTVRIFDFDGIRVAHMGDIGRALTEEESEKLRGLDCLILPVGGFYTIDAVQAREMVAATKPRVVIPIHYKSGSFGFDNIGSVLDFTLGLGSVRFVGSELELNDETPEGVYILRPANALSKVGERAIAYHDSGFNCAQAVLASLDAYTGMDEKTAVSVAGAFGGGLRSGEVCGSISGAAMALGLCFPHDRGTDAEAKARLAALAGECVSRCGKACGAVCCRDLLEQRGGKSSCAGFMAVCAEIAEKMINENR